jgi:tetratricopeptide (TPR) repeat protein
MKRSDPIDRAIALHDSGLAALDAGDASRARAELGRALAIFVREDPKQPDVANVLVGLSTACDAAGLQAEALRHAQRAAAIGAPLRGDADVARVRYAAFCQLASIRTARGEYALARAPWKRALRIAEASLGPVDVASARNGLGVVGKFTARYDDAEQHYRIALSLVARLPDAAPMRATLLHNLGGLEFSRGRPRRAEPHARASVALRERLLGKSHPSVAADLAALAPIVEANGARGEARALCRRAIRIFARAYGPRHFEVGFNVGQLAAFSHEEGRLAEAARLYARAIAILRGALGARHPFLATTLANFAALRAQQQRTREAAALYRRALAIHRVALGTRHPDARAAERALAALHERGPARR